MRYSAAWILVIVMAVGIRGATLHWPETLENCWKEMDYWIISSNFQRPDASLLAPRLDLRPDNPGFVEMEFPLVPWLTSKLYPTLGAEEWGGRTVSLAFSFASIVFLFLLVRSGAGASIALVSAGLLACNPFHVYYGRFFFSDGAMVCFGVATLWALDRWLSEPTPSRWAVTALLGALTLLTKLTGAVFGLVAILWLWARRPTRRVVFSFSLMLALAAAPAAAWHWHARRLFLEYGNTFGVFSGGHDKLQIPEFWLHREYYSVLARTAFMRLLTPPGAVLAAVGLAALLRRDGVNGCVRWRGLVLGWLGAWAAFVVIVAEGVTDMPYYHLFVTPALAAVMACGWHRLARFEHDNVNFRRTCWRVLSILCVAGILAGCIAVAWSKLAGGGPVPGGIVALRLTAYAAIAAGLCLASGLAWQRRVGRIFPVAGNWLLVLVLLFGVRDLRRVRREPWFEAQRLCGQRLKELSSRDDWFINAGCVVPPGGYDTETCVWYFSGRRGWPLDVGEFTPRRVEELRSAGARWFACPRPALLSQYPRLIDYLEDNYPRRSQSPHYLIYDLRSDPNLTAGGDPRSVWSVAPSS